MCWFRLHLSNFSSSYFILSKPPKQVPGEAVTVKLREPLKRLRETLHDPVPETCMGPVEANGDRVDSDWENWGNLSQPNLSEFAGEEAVGVNPVKLLPAYPVSSAWELPEPWLDPRKLWGNHDLLVELAGFRVEPHAAVFSEGLNGHVEKLDCNKPLSLRA
jgi:hypothetical protein